MPRRPGTVQRVSERRGLVIGACLSISARRYRFGLVSTSKMSRPSGSRRVCRIALLASLLALAALGSVGTSAALALGGWSPPNSVDPGHSLSAVSCAPGASACTAVDGSGNAVIYDGSIWSTPESVGVDFHSLSCPAAGFCIGGGEAGKTSKRASGAWSSASPDSTRTITGMSCVSAGFCVAVDSGGFALTWNGSGWTTPTSIASGRALTAVSCSASTFCVAVDSGGYALSFNGTSWSAIQVDPGHALTSVSCPGTGCFVVDDSGNVARSAAGTWTTPVNIDSGRALTSVSCPSSASCAAVDTAGNVLTYDGLAWSAPVNINPGHALTSVSCPSTGVCMAVDDTGNALRYPRSAAEIDEEADAAKRAEEEAAAAKRAEEAAATKRAEEAASHPAPAPTVSGTPTAGRPATDQGTADRKGLAKCVAAAKSAFGNDKKKAERRRGKARAGGLRSARKMKRRRVAACTRRFG